MIEAVRADPADYTVTLLWNTGETTRRSLRKVAGYGTTTGLADPLIFVNVRVRADGQRLEWPGTMSLDADSLWADAHSRR